MSNEFGITRAHIEEAREKGSCEFQSGCYLTTAADMMIEQAQWDDGDEAKNIDFSKCEFWVTTDDGQGPFGMDAADAED